MKAESMARLERGVRPLITQLPPEFVVPIYSKGRVKFLESLKEDIPYKETQPPEHLARKLWGIEFRSPIMNAAGMFKNGECYEVVARQGAGAYIAGTTTANSRSGNKKNQVYLPFTPYPRSRSASNWLGLPNEGDHAVSHKLGDMVRTKGCPVGASLMGSPDLEGEKKLQALSLGMRMYEFAGVDFIEINESCPNTSHGRLQDDGLAARLDYVSRRFINKRQRRVPVVVKFSNDTPVEQVPDLIQLLVDKGYDGVNFGNTSTSYQARREMIKPSERRLFDHFSKTFGGGVSGKPLKQDSLRLTVAAVRHLDDHPPSQEFHVIRTGGIENAEDIRQSEEAGVSLNQWFTGCFEGFARHGHDMYRNLYKIL